MPVLDDLQEIAPLVGVESCARGSGDRAGAPRRACAMEHLNHAVLACRSTDALPHETLKEDARNV